MTTFPHEYTAHAEALREGPVRLRSEGLPAITTAPPKAFGGPGDRWSPETLLVAAVADCFALSFRAIAEASDFDWVSLDCHVEGVLDKADDHLRFTEMRIGALLRVPEGTDEARAARLLDKAEKACLVTRSLIAPTRLDAKIEVEV